MKLLTIGMWILVLMPATDLYGQLRRQTDRSKGEFLQHLDRKATQSLIERRQQEIESSEYAEIFHSVQRGIAEGDVRAFSSSFGPQVYVSLPSGESGYYSANQAYYILQNYFGSRRPQSFRFSTYGESDSTPYATGPGRFEARGNIETVQIYASLSKLNNRWVLSHVSIY